VTRQVVGETPLLLPSERTNQVVLWEQRTMRIAWILGCACKPAIVVLPEEVDERVAGFAVVDAIQPKLFHESVLQRLMRALYPSFGSGRVGANHVDVEVLHRTAELRVADATDRFLLLTRKTECLSL
jgi:hypothetical protein